MNFIKSIIQYSESTKTTEQLSIFDAVNRIMTEGPKRSIAELNDYYFFDTMLVPLFVQQNYLYMRKKNATKEEELDRIAKAADCISMGDTVQLKIARDQQWTLAPTHALYSTILSSFHVKGHRKPLFPYENNYMQFPSSLGKQSTIRKNYGLLSNLHKETSMVAYGTSTDILVDYVPLWRQKIVQPLITKQMDGIDDAIAIMDEYRLSRDDIDTLYDLNTLGPNYKYQFNIPTKVKSAFTRQYVLTFYF